MQVILRMKESGMRGWSPRIRQVWSKDVLQSELDLPGSPHGAGDLTGCRCPISAGIKNTQRRVREVRVVQDIEEFRTELEIVPFANRRGLQQREIHGVVFRANQCVPARRSINTRSGIGEYTGIEIKSRRADRCADGNGAAADA